MSICPTCTGTGTIHPDALARIIADRPGAVGRHHPATSHAAAYSNVPVIGTQRWLVLDRLNDVPDATCAELAPRIGLSRNQTAARLWELHKADFVGYVRDEHDIVLTRPTGPRDRGQLHMITAVGVAALVAAT